MPFRSLSTLVLVLATLSNTSYAYNARITPRASARRFAPAAVKRVRSALVGKAAAAPTVVESSQKPSTSVKNRLIVRLNDKWVDLTGWRAKHPAGSHWIDLYDKADATEVMHAFHSDSAHQMLARLPNAKPEHVPEGVPEVTAHTRAFRKLREKLMKDGWFKRNPLMEAGTLAGWAATMVIAVMFAQTNVFLSALFLGISNTSAGWISHDYVHGRGLWCSIMRSFGQLGGGMSTTWWSDKHNLHHALTNVVGVDEDLMIDPALFLWAPDPKNDSPLRKFQHLYWMLPYSLLFLIWRVDSIRVAIRRRLWNEIWQLGAHYAILAALFPVKVLIPALFISGLLTATIVTVSHQSEDMFEKGPHEADYVESQFRSTRDFVCSNPFFEYLSGGMNYQLEHHLFPTMPRYKYPKLIPIVKQFAKENGLEYRVDSDVDILKRNIKLLHEVGQETAVEGAKSTRNPEFLVPTAQR